MFTAQDIRLVVMDELGYTDSPSLLSPDEAGQLHHIAHVDQVYVVNGVQVAYFSQPLNDEAEIDNLYKQVWSESKVPLLYVFLPHEVRVYNCYALPPSATTQPDENRLLHHLSNIVAAEQARQQVRTELPDYTRVNFDTGAFWATADGQRIDIEGRADRQLLRSVDELRRQLLRLGLEPEVAYTLLGRTIMIRCLEDRDLLNEPHQLRSLLEDRPATYDLFDRLTARFNGDLFPVSVDERSAVQPQHLALMKQFLDAGDLVSGQLRLWHYNFKYIPVELISNIYETFLPKTDQSTKGAYYTPPTLADFILEWSLPAADANITRSNMTILDPACGSGIFLARAFRRLVAAWIAENGGRPRASDLADLLKEHIFGVDIDPIAVRIASFSLYLAMLDYVDEDEVRSGSFRFPSLLKTNLLHLDFFDPEVEVKIKERLGDRQFDRIVGNLPWGRNTLTAAAKSWLKDRKYTVPNKQAAQAFLLRLLDFCALDGEIAVLAPTRSTMAAASGESFRTVFWERADVRSIVNFSALVYELFENASSPAVALFYKPKGNTANYPKIVYAIPKPSSLFQQLRAIVLDSNEVKYLDTREFQRDINLWKTAMWGNEHDAELIRSLQEMPTLSSVAERIGGKIYNGIKVGGSKSKQQEVDWLNDLYLLRPKGFRAYLPNPSLLEPLAGTHFERPRTRSQFLPPLALIKLNPRAGRLAASFSNDPVAYLDTISAVTGQQDHLLKWIVAVVNSRLAIYYLFLTSTNWAVERGRLLQKEYKRLPVCVPEQDDPRFQQLLKHFDDISSLLRQADHLQSSVNQSKIEELEAAVEKLVFELYGLAPHEQQLVNDMVKYGMGFFYWSKHPKRKYGTVPAVQPPTSDMMQQYADTFSSVVTALLKYRDLAVSSTLYRSSRGQPLNVVSFEIVGLADRRPTLARDGSKQLQNRLDELNRVLAPQGGQSIYTRRHIRIYDGNHIDFVRPNEQRFWTKSQALADANAVIADLLRRSRDQELVQSARQESLP